MTTTAPASFTDQRRAFAIQVLRSKLAKVARASKGGKTGGISRPKNSLSDNVTDKVSGKAPKRDTRAAVAIVGRSGEGDHVGGEVSRR
jgi:hypothetical protein